MSDPGTTGQKWGLQTVAVCFPFALVPGAPSSALTPKVRPFLVPLSRVSACLYGRKEHRSVHQSLPANPRILPAVCTFSVSVYRDSSKRGKRGTPVATAGSPNGPQIVLHLRFLRSPPFCAFLLRIRFPFPLVNSLFQNSFLHFLFALLSTC